MATGREPETGAKIRTAEKNIGVHKAIKIPKLTLTNPDRSSIFGDIGAKAGNFAIKGDDRTVGNLRFKHSAID